MIISLAAPIALGWGAHRLVVTLNDTGIKRSRDVLLRHLRAHSEEDSKVQKLGSKINLTPGIQTIRILLLGASECGKSTILKQMKILYMKGFSDDEKKAQLGVIRLNTIQAIQQLTGAALDLKLEQDAVFKKHQKVVSSLTPAASKKLGQEQLTAIVDLWKNSKTIEKAHSLQNRYYLLDNAVYMLDRVTKFFKADYIPTEKDILYNRLPSRGITETQFDVDGVRFCMIDVGGQRSERRKWIQCFDDVRAILFVISLSEYDQVLLEDESKNRMTESVALFAGIINLPWFRTTSVILFMNKAIPKCDFIIFYVYNLVQSDIFEEKIQRVDPGDYFDDYDGGKDEEKAYRYILDAYMNCNPKKTIFVHRTTATDTEMILAIWKACKSMILRANLLDVGLQLE